MKKFEFVRINSTFDIKCTVEKLNKLDTKYIERSEGRFRLTVYENEDGLKFYSYGLKSNGVQPGHGGEWSSRTDVINEVFGTNLIECSVKEANGQFNSFFAMAIDRKNVPVPATLEWRSSDFSSPRLYLPEGIELPRSNDYYRSTRLNALGQLITSKDDLISYQR